MALPQKHSMRSAWYLAIGIVAIFFLARSGGLAALQPLLKFIIPFAAIYWLVRRVQKKLQPFKDMAAELQRQQTAQQNETEGPVIQICPDCGHEKSAQGGCRC